MSVTNFSSDCENLKSAGREGNVTNVMCWRLSCCKSKFGIIRPYLNTALSLS